MYERAVSAENKLNEITVRNYGFTVEDSCGMFILWFGEDFEKNKAEAVHLLKRSLQKENKFRVWHSSIGSMAGNICDCISDSGI